MSPKTADGGAEHPWRIVFESFDPDDEGRREALLGLGNGMYAVRSAAPDAVIGDGRYPGTYRAGLYDTLMSRIAGEEVETETVVNLPNWLAVTFRIDGGPWFAMPQVEIERYRHALDLKAGLARRELTFQDAEGRRTQLREDRLVSMAAPHLVAMRLELEPLNWDGVVEIRSALDGDVVNANVARYRPFENRHLTAVRPSATQDQLALQAHTRGSRIEIAEAARHTLTGAPGHTRSVRGEGLAVAEYIRAEARRGRTLSLEKTTAIVSSLDPATAAPAEAAREALARAPDFAGLAEAQARAWRRLWARAGIEADGPDLAGPLRLHAFHLLQTVSPHSAELDTSAPARAWLGEGYRGHIFWDELFVLPFFAWRFPAIARSQLLYRYRRLDQARAAARRSGLRGAMFPWRSASTGAEVTPRYQLNLLSGRWLRDHTDLQRHVGAAVAFNVWRYVLVTGDEAFLSDHGAEMILEIARFYASLAQYDARRDRYEIRGVVGPDEYHNSYPGAAQPGVDNSAYTNLMAVWTLRRAPEVLDRLPSHRRRELWEWLGLTSQELARWEHITRRMRLVFHGDGVISQFEGFDGLREFDPERLPPELRGQRADWALEAIGETADAYQVTKQADVLTLFYLLPQAEAFGLIRDLGYSFGAEEFGRTADYYLKRTTHESSLSRVVYAGALARSDPDRSWRLFQEALGTDLHALKGESTAEGLHLGAMAGVLDVLQRRYLGVCEQADGLNVDPAIPAGLGPVRLQLRFRGIEIEAHARPGELGLQRGPADGPDLPVAWSGGAELVKPGASLAVPDRSGRSSRGTEHGPARPVQV